MAPIGSFLALAAILFCIGLYGALTKRNIIIVLLSIELMLNAANLNLIAFSRLGASANVAGQVFGLFSMTVAAAEVAVGLAILIALYRNRNSSDVRDMNLMKW
ncbi:NADH-quinone oxidoreductase subunit NuoK [Kyrpidia spormannii]|uniref:NADH-quinone oxidoreductase subunit K n=3 Tax=Kyrpidia TaxID=1129704 RepID=A0A2K8ND63_9BACL|nr:MULTISPECIES: NADH-quinone oxidoreductase subunit NuoK [Kyrpidia]HHY67218.1 NADH-quinone oxidoreductase subunit NuoK [Alicyclobacillus sp.]ADG07832.1 NADH-ubiquinone oxidoreductase chain 4L [Kyrpidia tusciae DSM 2912]ATY86232.1 NADH-quinone oxidoreductase subunit NuoK [Kyrpidia spormannii]MCL6576550.1 NADH-quinone oxidoreductase subunit NuoK [Kyrpidia sp.]CAB3395653.1 NADH-quinone oxidoreductase subunit K [Kyrpidia spormannii]